MRPGLDVRPLMEEARAMIDEARLQEQVVETLGAFLDSSLARAAGASTSASHECLKPFAGRQRCPLSASHFVRRIVKYGHCSPCCLLVGMIYVQRVEDRIADQQKSRPTINAFNIQRLLLTAVMLASKYLDDLYCSNKQWALIGDISTQELNALELHLLSLLRFSASVSREEYFTAFAALINVQNTGEFCILAGDFPPYPYVYMWIYHSLCLTTQFSQKAARKAPQCHRNNLQVRHPPT